MYINIIRVLIVEGDKLLDKVKYKISITKSDSIRIYDNKFQY